VTRPPLALERLSNDSQGRLIYALKRPFSNGTTHFVFEPLDLLAKLAALIPRPRANLTRYHGVFAPNAKWRAQIVPKSRQRKRHNPHLCSPKNEPKEPSSQTEQHSLNWAQRLKKTFDIDLSLCPTQIYCRHQRT